MAPQDYNSLKKRDEILHGREQNYFSGLEIYFKASEIYFSAAEIYFQATEIVLSQGEGKNIPRGVTFLSPRRWICVCGR